MYCTQAYTVLVGIAPEPYIDRMENEKRVVWGLRRITGDVFAEARFQDGRWKFHGWTLRAGVSDPALLVRLPTLAQMKRRGQFRSLYELRESALLAMTGCRAMGDVEGVGHARENEGVEEESGSP